MTMPVTSMTIKCGPTPKRRPQIGDTKVAKDGTILERRQCYAFAGGQWCGIVQNSRDVAEWVPKESLWPWEE